MFAAHYIKGVANGPSPAWLQTRLKAVGLRPINALVDVTNYISQDRGRPLHVYDADKLKGDVRARLGKAGETFLGLDGKEHAVDATMCVIADDNGPLGLGGIIGGEASGSTDATTNVLIECALFDPLRTAATGRKTGLVTDARYRFERGVDPQSVLPGLDLATQMIHKALRRQANPHGDGRHGAGYPPQHHLRYQRKSPNWPGLKLPAGEIREILESLGCEIDGKGEVFTVTTPSWRPDLHGSADLVEEVVRIAGIDRVPATPLPRPAGVARAGADRTPEARRAVPAGHWRRVG